MYEIQRIKRNLDPMTIANLVMDDPKHKARVNARRELERKARQTQMDKGLEASRAENAKLRKAHARKLSQMVIDHNATTAALVTASLAFGYILALICMV